MGGILFYLYHQFNMNHNYRMNVCSTVIMMLKIYTYNSMCALGNVMVNIVKPASKKYLMQHASCNTRNMQLSVQ